MMRNKMIMIKREMIKKEDEKNNNDCEDIDTTSPKEYLIIIYRKYLIFT